MNKMTLERIKGGLIVSCQALESEPLHSSYIMSRMAYAAACGGAVGIRANTVEDILEIRKTVDLPIIGIIKAVYGENPVYITPTMKEVDALVAVGVEIIAIDATKRERPDGKTLQLFFEEVRNKYPNQLFMADCSNYEEGIEAARLGFDLIGTTLHGYTHYTKGAVLPNYELIRTLVTTCNKPVIAEGGIWSPNELHEAMACGCLAAVVGTAITRPMEITQRYVAALPKVE
ncbi:MAG: N-acetylmannosamine-6-phosphate 2-epimerase [Cellulosilyticaceae bacterium]